MLGVCVLREKHTRCENVARRSCSSILKREASAEADLAGALILELQPLEWQQILSFKLTNLWYPPVVLLEDYSNQVTRVWSEVEHVG